MESRAGGARKGEACLALQALGEPVGGLDQGAGDAALEGRVAGVGHADEIRFGPGAVQVPGAADRADHVVAAVDDHRRDVPYAPHVFQELRVAVEPALVDEVVALYAGEGLRVLPEAGGEALVEIGR